VKQFFVRESRITIHASFFYELRLTLSDRLL